MSNYYISTDELYHYGVKGMKWKEHKYLARTGPNGEFVYSYNKKDQPQTAEDKRNRTKLEGYTNVLTRTAMDAASKTAKSTKNIAKPEPKTLKEAEKRVKEGIKKSKEKRKAEAKAEKARKKKAKQFKKAYKNAAKDISKQAKALKKKFKEDDKLATIVELAKHERAQKKKKRIEESKKHPTQGITRNDYSNETTSNRPHSRKRHDSGKSARVQLGKRRRSVKQQKAYEDSIRQIIEENRKEVTLRNGNPSDTGTRKKKRPHSRRRNNSGKYTYVVKRKMY